MILHASCIAHRGRGLLILGPSGAGKSTLALEMMAFGAGLVADDRTLLRRDGDRIIADSPPAIRGRIEARRVGILNARAVGPVPLVLAVDLGQAETDRLWNAIVGHGGQESECGWCKDKWGLSWQITPRALIAAITDPDPAAAKRAFDAMMTMRKIDIATIERARRG